MDLSKNHYVTRFHEQCKHLENRVALRGKINGEWLSITWKDFKEQVDALSLALLRLRVGIQEKVAIFSYNKPQWTIADMAIMQIRAVSVPIHATNTADQTAYILNNAEVTTIFVGNQEQYDKILSIYKECPKLKKVIAISQDIQLAADDFSEYWNDFISTGTDTNHTLELQNRFDSKSMDDLFTLIYTSGTTGQPKGVMLDFNNLAFQLHTHDIRLEVGENDVSLAFLPLSHIFERAWTAYILHSGAVNCYLEDTNQVKEALQEVKPTLMCAVPRFYEKIYATVYDRVSRSSLPKRILFSVATRIGKRVVKKRLEGKKSKMVG